MSSELAEGEAREAIDQLMVQATDLVYIQSLKSLRNSHTKICSLPPEVLSMVLVKAVEPPSDFLATSWCHHVQITAVCKLWRELTLSTPAFWSRIPLEVCKHLPEMIARSKCHPLSVRVNSDLRDHWYDSMAFIMASSHMPTSSTFQDYLPKLFDPLRLGEFHFEGSMPPEWWDHLPRTEAPVLRSLKISNWAGPTSMPTRLLPAEMPRLRHFHLKTVNIRNWVLRCRITNLTSLHLDALWPAPPSVFIWNIISSSPNLELLCIDVALRDNLEPLVVEAAPRLALPKLQSVHIAGPFRSCALLLVGITLPMGSRILFRNTDQLLKLQDEDALLLTRLLEACQLSTRTEPAREFAQVLLGAKSGLVSMELWQREQGPENSRPDILFNLWLPGMRVLTEALCIRRLESLQIKFFPDHTGRLTPAQQDELPAWENWNRFFQRHPSITKLRIQSPTITPLITSLAASNPGSKITKTSFLLPMLETLEVRFARMKRDRTAFEAMLCSRSRHQLALKELTVGSCRGFYSENMRMLRRRLREATVITWHNLDGYSSEECGEDSS